MASFAKNLGRISFSFGSQRRLVAVDYDSRELRIVHAEKIGATVRILKLSGTPMPVGMDVADAQALGAFLGDTLREMGLGGKPLLMNVSRGMAVLKTLSLPPGLEQGEVASMVQYQVEKELPFRLDEAVIDFTTESHAGSVPAAEGATAAPVLVAAVRIPVVDQFRQVALAAKTKLLRLGLRPYANHFCVDACTRDEPTARRVVVHLTADETEIDILLGESLDFSRAAVVKIPSAAEAKGDELSEAAASVSLEVSRTLQSYQSMESGGRAERIYVAGNTGIEEAVIREIQHKMNLPCQMLEVAGTFGLAGGGGNASEFISALGLVLGHGGDRGMPLDFLNPKRPPVQRDMKRIWTLGIGAAAAIILLVCVAAGASYIGKKEVRNNKLRGEVQGLEKTNKGIKASAERVKAVDSWLRQGNSWLDHWALVSCLFPSAADAYITNFKTFGDGSMNFTIRAQSSDVIADIARRLDEIGYDTKRGQEKKLSDYVYPNMVDFKIVPTSSMKLSLEGCYAQTRPADDCTPEEAAQLKKGSSAAQPVASPAAQPAKPPAEYKPSYTSYKNASPDTAKGGEEGKGEAPANGKGSDGARGPDGYQGEKGGPDGYKNPDGGSYKGPYDPNFRPRKNYRKGDGK